MVKKNERRINDLEMRCLRSKYGVSRRDRGRNNDVRERCGLKEGIVIRVEKAGLIATNSAHRGAQRLPGPSASALGGFLPPVGRVNR
ncbi:hypothetical protein EVAR_37116_1 [Eumeta japonica]|uniref:Uncharacterized protein n=1 Tax=Eumeta variegata TaxID=151549 RepID=A0A4C1XP57_EUMVA|nr:hypothetical protein EVAR_37116_1 [Eumeta japonica]